MTGKHTRRLAGAILGLFMVWGAFALLVVPRIVRAAYDRTGPSFLHGIITGREAYPVEYYLALANRASLFATVGLVLATLVALAIYRFRAPVRTRFSGILHTPPIVGARETVLLGA